MKISIVLISLLVAAGASAESPFTRDFKKLTEDRDRALAAVSDPIQLKYKALLEQLMQKATSAQDLDAAIQIKEAIAKIPTPASVKNEQPKTAEELKEFLHRTKWDISNSSPTAEATYTLTFNKNGTFKHTDGRTGGYEALGPKTFKMWGHDTATLNDGFTEFRAVAASGIVYFGRLKKD
ncbi:MAG: hypothetical protein V4689_04335 [Verrucomicrobiota bacterium]